MLTGMEHDDGAIRPQTIYSKLAASGSFTVTGGAKICLIAVQRATNVGLYLANTTGAGSDIYVMPLVNTSDFSYTISGTTVSYTLPASGNVVVMMLNP